MRKLLFLTTSIFLLNYGANALTPCPKKSVINQAVADKGSKKEFLDFVGTLTNGGLAGFGSHDDQAESDWTGYQEFIKFHSFEQKPKSLKPRFCIYVSSIYSSLYLLRK